MGKRLAVVAALGIVTLLGYFRFPGHTYLQSDTQIYVPILEHLRDPGVLTNDIVATRPHVSYTIYDEVSRALRAAAGTDFEWVLEAQQLLFRFLGVAGAFLIALSLGLSQRMAVLVAAALALGATIGGPAVLTVEYEPVPRGFAVPLMLLAIGLAAHGRMLPAGLAAGAAILYHPPTTLPLLAALVLAQLKPGRRQWLKMAAPVGAAIVLLIILSKLQAGVSERQVLFGRIEEALANMQRYRATYNWVSLWPGYWFPQHVLLWLVCLAAWWRLRPVVNDRLQPFFVWMPIYGLLMIPVSYVVLEVMRWSIMPQLQPARAVLFVTLFAVLGAAAAGIKAAQSGGRVEAFAWFALVYLLPANVRVIPDFGDPLLARRLLLVTVLAALAALAGAIEKHRWGPPAWAAAVALPFFLIPGFGRISNYPELHTPQLDEVARWAREATSREAVFLFPDAGRRLEPGVFRVRALRAVHVDWKSGGQVNLLKDFADEWWRRWNALIPARYESPDFQLYARHGIDYIVLRVEHRLPDRKPAYENSNYVVYAVAS